MVGYVLNRNRTLIKSIYPPPQIHVKISGNITHPGIYNLDEGQTIQHLVDKAGGLIDNNDNSDYNPEEVLRNGQVIVLGSGKKNVR